jgi:hypothetical protein
LSPCSSRKLSNVEPMCGFVIFPTPSSDRARCPGARKRSSRTAETERKRSLFPQSARMETLDCVGRPELAILAIWKGLQYPS